MRVQSAGWSVRARLTTAAALVIVVLLSAAAAVLVWRVDSALRTGTDDAARRAAADLAATGANAPSIPSSPGAGLVQVTDRSHKVVASSPAIDGEPLAFRVEVAPSGNRRC